MTDELNKLEQLLKQTPTPEPSQNAKKETLFKAMAAFDKKSSAAAQGTSLSSRLMDAVRNIQQMILERDYMKKAYALAGVCAVGLFLLHNEFDFGTMPSGLTQKDALKEPHQHKETVAAATQQSQGELMIQSGSLPSLAQNEKVAGIPAMPMARMNAPVQSRAKEAVAAQNTGGGSSDQMNSVLKPVHSNTGADASELTIQPGSLPSPVSALDETVANAASAPAPMEERAFRNDNAITFKKAQSWAPQSAAQYQAMQAYIPAPGYQQEERDKFEHFDSNPFKDVKQEPVSTFSADVDTSSYTFMRATLNQGRIPAPDEVRIEEMVNYFPYDYEVPSSKEEPFKASVAVFPTPWNPDTKLMRIGIKAYQMDQTEKPHSNLVFLLDTSGSMNDPVRLPLIISSLKMLLDELKPDDTVAIVTYAGQAGVALEPTLAKEKGKIVSVLDGLHAFGSTAGFDGLQTAYRLAEQNFDAKSVNRVILSTDGDFNVGITDSNDLKGFITRERDKGIFLSILGVGMGNYNDALMQTLAQNGNGVAAYIDNLNEARKVLVEEAGSTLFTVARDVKFQVEFNPAQVAEYRLVGYESRMLKREDFNNDKVDAGDVGAGHAVTALYEITPVSSKTRHVDELRYHKAAPEAEEEDIGHGEYAFVKMRYKLPDSDTSKLISTPVDAHNESKDLAQAPQDARFAAAVAAFGELLKGDTSMSKYSYDDVMTLAQGARGEDVSGYRAEFIHLVELAKHLASTTTQAPQ